MTVEIIGSTAGPLNPDGTFEVTVRARLTTPPPPPPPPITEPTTVRIGTTTRVIDAINPTPDTNPAGAPYDGCRGPNQLVVYRAPVTTPATNPHGWEAGFGADGLIRRAAVNVPDIPPGGGVLSGHGPSADWVRTHATVGAQVAFTTDPVPPPPPPPAPVGSGHLSTWTLIWPDSPNVDLATIPLEFDELRIAFANGPGTLVGDGPSGLAALKAGLKGFLAARPGRIVSVSVGGGGYEIDVTDPTKFVTNLGAAERRLGVTWGGINWDWESSAFRANAARCVDITRTLKGQRGGGFWASWSPNGSWKWDYRDALRGTLDVVDELAMQFYDTPVTYAQASGIVDGYLQAGFSPAQVGIGMMVGDSANYWTLPQCVDYMTRLKAQHGVSTANLWEASRVQTVEWARAIRGVVG